MASFSCLCAARDEVLRRAGHDVEQLGLHGASLRVFVGAERHSTIHTALRMLGIGRAQVIAVEADAQGRMRADALRAALTAHAGPSIICAQAGNVNSGAFDPFEDIVSAAHARGAWVHVDGAFGLWAAVVPTLRAQLRGVERADSWAVDVHKWLNVPYDSGFAIVADAGALRAAVRTQPAAYLVRERGERDGSDWAPESSRRARAFVIYAALRSLGRSGLSELIERNCRQARQLAERLARDAGATIVNDVVLNQVLVRFGLPGADPAREDALMRAVVQRVQEDGVCWVGPTVYRGRVTMRIALSNWSTTDADIERSAAAISDALRVVREQVRHDAG
jgi:glutamate/tyrosine decarboxylase-like PLP-dependent enzyme